MKVLKCLGNPILRLAFASKIHHNRAILRILDAEFIESSLEILSYPESTIGPTVVVPKKNFENKVSQIARKR